MAVSQKNLTVLYWTITGLICFAMAASGITSLLHTPQNIEGMAHLGYPYYMLNILGLAKVLGVLALVTNKFPRIKEWAYAGFTFDIIGAFLSMIFIHDYKESVFPLIFLALVSASYYLWHKLYRKG